MNLKFQYGAQPDSGFQNEWAELHLIFGVHSTSSMFFSFVYISNFRPDFAIFDHALLATMVQWAKPL